MQCNKIVVRADDALAQPLDAATARRTSSSTSLEYLFFITLSVCAWPMDQVESSRSECAV